MTAPALLHADAPVHAQADAVRDSLTCPQCQYSLRGLPGEVIHCPECGLECDIRRMMTDEWRRPWYEAPGFVKVLMPVTQFVFSAFVLMVVFGLDTATFRSGGLLTLSAFVVLAVIWSSLLLEAKKQFHDGRGIALALLAHALFAGYLAGSGGILFALFGVMLAGPFAMVLIGLVMIAVMIGLFVLCRRGERYIAQQCLNEYLRRDASPPTSWNEIVSS